MRHRILAMTAVVATAGMLCLPAAAWATGAADGSLPELGGGERLYDTSSSLSEAGAADVAQALGRLVAVGADPVVLVRELDASPEETLEQAEALQQAWVAATGADQDVAVAVLVNRNPDDPGDARAGVFVGSTYDDGNVPEDEQRTVVDEFLIPPLADGDVRGSLVDGLGRLTTSVQDGPPPDAFELWAPGAARGWLSVTAVALALAGLLGVGLVSRRRATTDRPDAAPTTRRPGELAPALAGALVAGGPRPSALAATLLDLGARGALALEPEKEGSRLGRPTVQVRLLDRGRLRHLVEEEVWRRLEEKAEGGLVTSGDLRALSGSPGSVTSVLARQMRENAWSAPGATTARTVLFLLGVVGFLGATFLLVVSGVGGVWWPSSLGVALLAVLAVAGVTAFARYSPLTTGGQEAAIAWRAYRDGLQRAAKDGDAEVDLDDVLPDAVAMDLAHRFKARLEAAEEQGRVPRAFAAGGSGAVTSAAFPWWLAFTATTSNGSGAGSTVSAGGAGGGGGAAGST